ncbi:MAG TPA: HAMP domain-containing sensor histidine kinase [Planctomycetota bacterium]|nr:HAMP domain-containing sensor histidine kinase [Planctomycetota bacterium]
MIHTMTDPESVVATDRVQLEHAVVELTRISAELLASYQALEARAGEVEAQLSRANQEIERLHGLDKLAALGNMAGGIAHELRNPMNAVKGFAGLLQARLPEESKERRWAALIVDGVGEADAILGNLLSLARPEKLVLETIDGVEFARAALEATFSDPALAAARERWVIECATTPAPLPPFIGDRLKLRQALRNLIANALEAQPSGGKVRATLEVSEREVVMTVDDAGPGLAPEIAARVLEPFFTTRAEGTGLGLAFVRQVAELHGGRVEVHGRGSALGGARFVLCFPLVRS